jgi:hypothetical protein
MTLEPITRQEKLLNAVATGESANIKPITREEMFLAKAGGQNVQTPTPITRKEMFLSKISCGSGGGGNSGGGFVEEKDIRFMDYDGTLLYSYSVDEFAAMTELPPLPEQKGLICQGWNWNLEDIKAMGRAVDVGAMYITDDGKTRLYIHLEEGRTAPMVGVCPNGTVTVDWGDGSEPDVLTGTSVSAVKWTPNHEYGKAGDYVISLTVDGKMGFYGAQAYNQHSGILRYSSSSDARNYAYQNAVNRVEVGSGVTYIDNYAFYSCYSLTSITIPNGVTSIRGDAFNQCYSLTSITIPNSVTFIGSAGFSQCYSLASVAIPNSVTSVDSAAFQNCYSLTSVAIPNSVKSIGSNAFKECRSLTSITIPNGVTSVDSAAFENCHSLTSVAIPNSVKSIVARAFYGCQTLASVAIPNSVTSIGNDTFNICCSLTSVTIPNGVTSIGAKTFYSCYSVSYYDFTTHAAVPTLSSTNAFTDIPADCEIRVPAALYDEWIAATNWATYASKIVAKEASV